MNIIAIVQARMGSTRLPGKVMLDVGGQPVLARVVTRLRRARNLSAVVVATVAQPASQPIIELCHDLQVPTFSGSELNVLDRYYQAAQHVRAHVILRIMSDCPVIDPNLVDECIRTFQDDNVDYASNTIVRTYPRGLDTEIMTFAALERAWQSSVQHYERVHVTPYIYEHPDIFRVRFITNPTDVSHYRWTIDTPDDLKLLRAIYAHFDNRDDFSWQDVLSLMKQTPALSAINAHIEHKPLQAL